MARLPSADEQGALLETCRGFNGAGAQDIARKPMSTASNAPSSKHRRESHHSTVQSVCSTTMPLFDDYDYSTFIMLCQNLYQSESTYSSDSCSSINPGSVEPQDMDDCVMNQITKSSSPSQHDYLPFYNLCPSQVIFTSNASSFDSHPGVCNKSIP
uniref:Uncharacterized protein n=1 Tax=Anopheles dirus TaxID=7168 RepID=A0A182NLV3_9DIPT